jgi:hypothetical protein
VWISPLKAPSVQVPCSVKSSWTTAPSFFYFPNDFNSFLNWIHEKRVSLLPRKKILTCLFRVTSHHVTSDCIVFDAWPPSGHQKAPFFHMTKWMTFLEFIGTLALGPSPLLFY